MTIACSYCGGIKKRSLVVVVDYAEQGAWVDSFCSFAHLKAFIKEGKDDWKDG